MRIDSPSSLYTWSAFCPNEAKEAGIECCRMLWGPEKLHEFRQLRTTPGTKTLMGMNEVNEPSQANMSPAAGVKLWNEDIRPFGLKGYRLVSPAVTSAPSGLQWFQDFFAKCGDYDGQKHCGVDIMAIHYYGTQVSAFQGYVTKFHDVFGIPIWVTEFACENFSGQGGQCSKDDVWTFMTGVTSWMNATPWIEAYFAFGLLHDMWNVNYENQLMDKDGRPTDLGSYFLWA
ncbi:glycoside hydrolase family 128 protein [Hydnum rufescens UP504]|uniref:Glycoside hydrolase family 128 protein n=1 Tax=Hydnum rufescens UP504 TaxID=1448309 RepID=A0A9P6E2T2_9AGAM|nr:glycoside hydrolase family 128 protein [Hydnum rufescens UP504]